MTKQPAIKTDWQTIDPASLPAPIAKQYARYKDAYLEMKAERNAFEQAMRDLAPAVPGKRLVFGYNYGKIAVALVDDTAAPAKASGSLSLSAFLAGQAASGKRT